MNRISIAVALVAILSVATFFRLQGIAQDVPFIYHPDEPYNMVISQNIVKTGDLNPHFFKYPSLFFYIRAAGQAAFYMVQIAADNLASFRDIELPHILTLGVTKSPSSALVIFERLLTILFGLGTIVLTFFIGKKIANNSWTGLFAAFLLAISPLSTSLDRTITPDTYAVFFVLLAFFFILKMYQQPDTKNYILAGFVCGLAASVKYNAGLIFVPLAIAHLFLYKKSLLRHAKIYYAVVAAGLGFLLTTPFALLDFMSFLRDFHFEMMHYSKIGHEGMEGQTLSWYLAYLYRNLGWIPILAVIELVRGAWSKSKMHLLLAGYPVLYFIMVSRMTVRNDRTILLITPFLFILAAWLVVYLFQVSRTMKRPPVRFASVALLVLLVGVLAWRPLDRTLYQIKNSRVVDSRKTARVWAEQHFGANSKIALESYTFFLSPDVYDVTPVKRIIDFTPAWYAENGYDYLIFGQSMFQKFFRNAESYQTECEQYDRFFNALPVERLFKDGDYEIRIYRIDHNNDE